MRYLLLLLSVIMYGQDLQRPILYQAAIGLSLKLPDRAASLTSESMLPRWHLPRQRPNITGGTLVQPFEKMQQKRNIFGSLFVVTQTHTGWSELKLGCRAVWMPTKRISFGVQRLNGKLGGELLTFIRYN